MMGQNRFVRMAGLSLPICFVPAVILAQATPAQTENERVKEAIIVTGAKVDREVARERATAFVRQVGVANGNKPAARWVSPACIKMFGLNDVAMAERVQAKFKSIAEGAKVPVYQGKCQTNLAIIFAADGGEIVRQIQKKEPSQLSEVPLSAKQALLNGDQPVRWWYSSVERAKGGLTGSTIAAPWTGGNSEHGNSVIATNGETPTMDQRNASIVSTQVIRAIRQATVVIDVDRAQGVPLDAVAAYAAFVAFAEIKPVDTPPDGSILALFTGRSGVDDVSDMDIAFLKALYALPLDRQARRHRGLLIGELIEQQLGEQ